MPEMMKGLSAFEQGAVLVVLAISIFCIIYAFVLRAQILRQDKGTPRMQEVWGWIKEGANAYLSRQFRTIMILIGVLTFVLAASVLIIPPTQEATEVFGGGAIAWVAVGRAIAFLMGSLFSYSVGFVGMNIAVEANVRVAAAARKGYNPALQTAYRSGTVTGMLTVGLGLLGGTLIFIVFGIAAPDALLGFGFGGSLIALFMRVGGGIYTKAADVGADLVGKVEAGIPEDDPRNAAVIADLVGDNVGDCAGRGADLFESTAAENIGAMILGVAIYLATNDVAWIFFPLVVRAVGLLASIVGVYAVSFGEIRDPMRALDRGYWTMTVLAALGIIFVTLNMLGSWWLVACGLTGLATSVAFVYLTQYYTAGSWRPVQEIARASKTGPATNIIAGFAVGLETTGPTAIVISLALLLSFFFGEQWARTV